MFVNFKQIKARNLDPEELPNWAIIWKKARVQKGQKDKDSEKIDKELAKINPKIVSYSLIFR